MQHRYKWTSSLKQPILETLRWPAPDSATFRANNWRCFAYVRWILKNMCQLTYWKHIYFVPNRLNSSQFCVGNVPFYEPCWQTWLLGKSLLTCIDISQHQSDLMQIVNRGSYFQYLFQIMFLVWNHILSLWWNILSTQFSYRVGRLRGRIRHVIWRMYDVAWYMAVVPCNTSLCIMCIKS